ncbi:MAG: glycosyltransferase [Microthrixaceae bacterium]
MAQRPPIDVLVVIVLFNSSGVLPDCLRSLAAGCEGTTWHLVAADNASTDEGPDLVRRLVPDSSVEPLGANLGYAAAINAAVAAGPPSRSVLVLNPDTRLTPGVVRRLLGALDGSTAGIVVPAIDDEHGGRALSLRREPTARRTLSDALIGGTRPRRRLGGEMVTDPAAYRRAGWVDWATGAALLVDRALHERLGGWDERFFLYSEETDFMLRARDLGRPTLFVPDAVVIHLGGEGNTSPRLYRLMALNRVRLQRKRHGAAAAAAMTCAQLVYELPRCLRRRGAVHRAAVAGLLTGRAPMP